LIEPPLSIPDVLNEMPAVKTSPLMLAFRFAVLNAALLLEPFVASHAVPDTPDHPLVEVSHVPEASPDQTPVAAEADRHSEDIMHEKTATLRMPSEAVLF
jgi:hypothetical protein